MTSASGGRERALFRARRSRPQEPRTYRLANSIRLPFFLGGVALLAAAIATSVLVGRAQSGEVEVPGVVLDYQESLTLEVAQSVRRSVNEGVEDLEQMALTFSKVPGNDRARTQDLLKTVAETHDRYRVVYVLDRQRNIVASLGNGADPKLITGDPFDGAGVLAARERSGLPVIPQFAAVRGRDISVVGHYDHEFLRFAMQSARPGEAWLVDGDGRIIAASGNFSPFAHLPRRALRDAADRADGGQAGSRKIGGSLETEEIVSFAPVSGPGPAGRLGWSVVTGRRVPTMALPEVDARRQGFVAGVIMIVLVLAVFGWLWLIVLRPVLRLQKEAERLAYGDLSVPVEIVRYDEVGLIARALERIRISLVRRKVQGDPPDDAGGAGAAKRRSA